MKPIITIIIATFNSERFIQPALESVKNQSFQDWECLIVDGVSKDKTLSIVKKYIEADERYRYISEPDKGIYDALNKGVGLAKGDWIYILGSDDKVTYEGLSELMKDKTPCDVKCGNIILDYNGCLKYKKAPSQVSMLRKSMVYSHQAIIMKRKIFETIGRFNLDYPISADYDMLLRAYVNGFKIHYCDVYVAVFNMGGSSSVLVNWDLYKIRKSMNTVSLFMNLSLVLRRTLSVIFKRFKSKTR